MVENITNKGPPPPHILMLFWDIAYPVILRYAYIFCVSADF